MKGNETVRDLLVYTDGRLSNAKVNRHDISVVELRSVVLGFHLLLPFSEMVSPFENFSFSS